MKLSKKKYVLILRSAALVLFLIITFNTLVMSDEYAGLAIYNNSIPQSNNLMKITQLEQINTFLYKGPVFVEMGYELCRPCQAMKPILEKLAVEYKGKATIVFIDIHQSPELAKYFEISTHTPDSFVIVGTENGKYVYISDEGKINMDRSQARIIGLVDKNEQIFKKMIDLAIIQQDKSKSI